MPAIDLNRGVVQQNDAKTGTAVFMYVDEPGVFLNAHGTEVSDELARSANFDVDELLKLKSKNAKLAKARADIEADSSTAAGEQKVVDTKNGFQLVDIGLDRYVVKDPDGKTITPQALKRDDAQGLLDRVTVGATERDTKAATKNPDAAPKAPPVVSNPGGPGPSNAPGDAATRAAADKPLPGPLKRP